MHRFTLFIVFAVLFSTASSASAQQQNKIPVYLPISGSDYPNIKHHLDAALFEHGLGQFSTQTTDYWHAYQQGIKQGRPGIYLAAPHFVAWASYQHNFTAILKLESKIQYVLAVRSKDINLFEVDDLNNRSVCTQAGLNLDTILLNKAFTNPLYSAHNKAVSDVAKEIVADNKECHAFTVANHLFLKHNLAHPESLIRLQQGQAWPPYAWIIHPQLEPQKQAISNFFQSEKTREILNPVLQRFSEGQRLLSVKERDYPKSLIDELSNYWGHLKNEN